MRQAIGVSLEHPSGFSTFFEWELYLRASSVSGRQGANHWRSKRLARLVWWWAARSYSPLGGAQIRTDWNGLKALDPGACQSLLHMIFEGHR